MAEKIVVISQQLTKPIKLIKWKVSPGNTISSGRVVLLYDFEEANKSEQRKLKSVHAGTVHRLIAEEDAIVKPGEPLMELSPCIHPTVMKDMCAECGADLRKDDLSPTASVPMVHSIPELKVSQELAQKLGKADCERLLKDRKLVLLVDLDQTLIHTTNDNIPANIKDVYHFQLYGPNSPWYHTRLRPGTHQFLSNINAFYELHICTFGARNYAHTITMFLDKDGQYFSNRILSRDECFDPTSKKANLKALFPCGDNMVCIIDDREDVWSNALNLIHVKPYHFFQHTGDINAPPGLDKHEDDDKVGVDLTKIKTKTEEQPENYNSVEEDQPDRKNGEKTATTTPSTETNGETENKETKTNEEKPETEANNKEEEKLQDVEDPDDYLLFLEDILKSIHKVFYEEYDRMEVGKVPDLKQVIPNVRGQILKGTKLVFSGLVPTHVKLEQSKAYQVARSLGAEVTQDLEEDTTHLVAVRPGTAKVNAAKRRKTILIVTPDWLWSCAECWEHVDERVYPLNSKGSKNRHPPPHCGSPVHLPSYPVHDSPAMRKRTPSGRFMDTINPLMSFSSADIADMDKEVEDILDDESDSDEGDGEKMQTDEVVLRTEESSSSAESMTAEYPRGYKRAREKEFGESEGSDIGEKFRRGETVDDDLDLGGDSNSEQGSDGEIDDGEWNMMGAALEREFLSNN